MIERKLQCVRCKYADVSHHHCMNTYEQEHNTVTTQMSVFFQVALQAVKPLVCPSSRAQTAQTCEDRRLRVIFPPGGVTATDDAAPSTFLISVQQT